MTKDQKNILSIVLIVAGIALLFFGFQSSGSFESKLSSAFSGSASEKTIMLYVLGAASLAAGLFFKFK